MMKTSLHSLVRSVTTVCALLLCHGAAQFASAEAVEGGTLDPTTIPKYAAPLVIPPAMPRTSKLAIQGGKNIDYYEIAVRQFEQQILPPGLPPTTVWSYGSVNHPGSFNYPAFTIEAKYNAPVRVKWINDLVDAQGKYLPHLLPVDPTLHWANPPGPIDHQPMFMTTPGRYTGPVPIVTHLHGGHTTQDSDGYAEAWYLPAANNLAGYTTTGTWYATFKAEFEARWGQAWEPGTAIAQYPNDQRAATLWYHDHSLGMTRANVYAGPAGFYLLRGGPADAPAGSLPGPAPALGDVAGINYYEIPLAIQDRSFNSDGSLFYPASRSFFDEFDGPYVPFSDIPPIWNPEFFGNTMLVNGRTWPVLNVEARRYRFRILNGCNSRFLVLKLVTPPLAARPVPARLSFTQIGADGGFLPAPVVRTRILLGPAERADVVVDFSKMPAGTQLYMINEGPDEPFGGGDADNDDFDAADPMTTGQVMKFVVGKGKGRDPSLPPAQIAWPVVTPAVATSNFRKVALLEDDSAVLPEVGPRVALLGTVDSLGMPTLQMWGSAITEAIKLNQLETWEIYNFTADAHPIHLHQTMFQVVNRQALVTDDEGIAMAPAQLSGPAFPADAAEKGFKDTVVALPGQVTRLNARFDLPGRFVWHCHILEHEDNEMMRPLQVAP